MEAIAMDLVKDTVQSLLKSIMDRIGEEISLAWGFKEDLKDLEKKLTRLNCLLSGADSEFGSGLPEYEKLLLRDWMKNVAEVAYRAEDVVDEYAYEMLKRKLALRDMASMQPLLRFKTRVRFFCFSRSSNPVVLRFRMAHKVKSLKESIAKIYADAKDLAIKPVEVAAAATSSTDHATAAEMALQLHRAQVDSYEVLVGRDHIKAEIIQLLHQASNSPKRLSVVGVHGMPGIGKTKLCHNVSQTTEAKEYFKEQIWICVSHDFVPEQLLKTMIEQLGEPSTMSNIEAIKRELQVKLEGRKYLLVLDDVWDTFGEVWEPLRCCLQDIGELKGNAILVTSRSKEVLSKLETHASDPTQPMEGPCIHELPGLLEADTWSLFKQKLGNDLLDSTHRVKLAGKMLTKCGGVPLAIKTLAGLLRSRNDVQQWKEIEASSIWKEDGVTLPASIKLSFKYLPSVALKKCFVYCAIFPEDEIIKKDNLIQLWMAQGFLQHPDDEMEKVGEEYFHFLLNNSLFQDAEFDDLGHVISCKMHDAVHALARTLLRSDVTLEMRHLSLSQFRDVPSIFELGGNLRTFFGSFIPITFVPMKTISNLRALSLVRARLTELPNSIGELKHLRYLDISENMIESLPDGLTRLYHLQTFRSGRFIPLGSFTMLPKGFSNLIKLRHIVHPSEYHAMGIPIGLGMLTCLRTLPTIDASAGSGGRLSELQSLSKLEGRLSIEGLEQVEIEEAKKVNLGVKENIKELVLRWAPSGRADTKTIGVAEALQPHSNLASLTIHRYDSKALPQWVTKMMGGDGSPFRNLVRLEIEDAVRLEHMPISLENLVTLKELCIRWCSSVITFPQHLECLVSLQELVVQGCLSMQNLVADMTPLLNLRKVKISYCRNMTCLPTGMSNLPGLESLDLGPFSPELDVFPFPPYNHDYEDCILPNSTFNHDGNGCSYFYDDKHKSEQLKAKTPTMLKERTVIKGMFESLVKLLLCGEDMEKVNNLPNQVQYLSQLRSLDILSFSSLEALPEWLGNLTSLHTLDLIRLPNLKSLPSEAAMGRLSQLTSLSIHKCPLLKEACDMETGTEWSKIKHIPRLSIN